MSQFIYIEVVLPLPLANSFTYVVPSIFKEKLKVGIRVIVPFGSKKIYTGIVSYIHLSAPDVAFEVRPIIDLLDEEPILCWSQLRFWEWIASYYQCTMGEVYKAALPSSLKIESETVVQLNREITEDEEPKVSAKEALIISVLSTGSSFTIAELQRQTKIKNMLPSLKMLMDRKIVLISEELKETYRPKTEIYVKLATHSVIDDSLNELLNSLARSPKQLSLVRNYLELSGISLGDAERKEVSKKQLLEKSEVSTTILTALVKKNLFELYEKEIGRISTKDDENILVPAFPLNAFQEKALSEIVTSFTQKNVTLLHGVTASGKTEIYIHLIKEMLQQGKQVLYLVPEIALTAQITKRLKRVFGSDLGIYHSKFSDNERVEVWYDLLNHKNYKIILGVRSSIFLPFDKLGLVIVDEEHENTYKQFDPAPRYHARNAAIMLASIHGAKTLLGTATPAIETFYNATTGKYGYVQLTQRHQSIQLPEVHVVDTKELKRKKLMKSYYSPLLIEKIKIALDNNEQVILFQNRRGYAPYIECSACAWVPKCKNCDVSLTYHKFSNQLTCHYCGYALTIPHVCPSCQSTSISTKGLGTEKIAFDIEELFPNARVARMDLDATRTKNSFSKLIADFEQHNIDILVGTQMVSKGLDFERVSVVGVLNADSLLNFPDFRAHERAFQLLTQVSGRAGRKNKRGLVIIQTSEPDHPVIRQVTHNDYRAMFDLQLQERKLFSYPPFFRLIYLLLKHKDASVVNKAANLLGVELQELFGNKVLGPEAPIISRVKSFYLQRFMIKVDVQIVPDKAKKALRDSVNLVLSTDEFRSLLVSFDVDPM